MSKGSNDFFTEKFFTWMDSAGLKPKDLAPELHKKVQTILNWRSKGVPTSQLVACEAVMQRYIDQATEDGSDQEQVFVIKPSYKQFRNWNRAANNEGKLMEDWALDGLDAMAYDSISRSALAVAEERTPYPAKTKTGGKSAAVKSGTGRKGKQKR